MFYNIYQHIKRTVSVRSVKKNVYGNNRWRRRFHALSLIGVLLLLWPIFSISSQQDVGEEEYRVYSDYLNGLTKKDLGKLVPIDGHTLSLDYSGSYWGEVSSKLKKEFVHLSQETLDDFYQKDKNGPKLLVTARFNIKVKHVLLRDPANEIREDYITKGERGWKNFYRKYPGATGLVTFSRVGFNRSVDEALVHVVAQSGLTSGASFFALLRKQKGVWRIISTLTMTQS